ncbi:MAG: nucleoside diphosphate kinase regulator [Burkholderiales bacterium]|nr:nucleoside diphosphate kinase regulator [Burkholderiales bacterium]
MQNHHHLFLTEGDFVRVMALQPHPSLRAELERAIVVPPEAIPSSVVAMNSKLRYLDEAAGVSRQIQIVYPEDANVAHGKISVLAPVGAALLGLEVGHAIDWNFPNGETRRLRVEEVLQQFEADANDEVREEPLPNSSSRTSELHAVV